MKKQNPTKPTKSQRKDFRASQDELLLLERHCTEKNIKHSDFIRSAILEKIERERSPFSDNNPLSANDFYNYVVRRSITSPVAKKIITDYTRRNEND